jgi:ferritin-like metal-binding protein YciE
VSADKLQTKLGDYLEDTHALETNVLQMLGSMIATTDDAQIRGELERHREQTEEHERRLRGRLEAIGRSPSLRKEAQTIITGLLKGVADQVRGDKAGKNARDAYVTEHMEIAAYELLERLAERAGDQETAELARRHKREEQEMAARIAANWDRSIELTLVEAGIAAAAPQGGADVHPT